MNVRCIRNVVSITSLKANVDLVNLNVYEIEKKKIEMADSKKLSKSPILNIFCENFMDWFLD